MNTTTGDLSIAETRDRHAALAMLGVLAFGLKYAIDAGAHFVDPDLARIMDWAGIGLMAASVVLILPILVWKFRHFDAAERRAYFSDDSFVGSLIKRAHIASWAVTLLCLLVFDVVSRRLPEVASAFFLEVALAASLIAFAATFLILDRASGSDSDA